MLEALAKKTQVSKVSYNSKTQLTALASAPILGADGEVQYIFNNVRDITTLNHIQDSLNSKDEIIRLENLPFIIRTISRQSFSAETKIAFHAPLSQCRGALQAQSHHLCKEKIQLAKILGKFRAPLILAKLTDAAFPIIIA